MLDHVSISVKNYEQSLQFYDATLAALGYERVFALDIPEKLKAAGYGKNGKPSFWISPMGRDDEDVGRARGVHLAFVAPNAQAVEKWYNACLEMGAKDNGKPGPRPEYHPGYYGAFVIDPNGWRIEACFHEHKS